MTSHKRAPGWSRLRVGLARLTLTLLCTGAAQDAWGQQWTLVLAASQDGVSQQLTFGVHPGASDGLDPELGEVEQPPLPPAGAGALDARFVGPGLRNGVRVDLRPSSTTREYALTIQIQQAHQGGPLLLRWNAGEVAAVTSAARLRDPFGGTIVDVDMRSVNTVSVDDPNLISRTYIDENDNILNEVVVKNPAIGVLQVVFTSGEARAEEVPPDRTPPRILGSTPADGATGVDADLDQIVVSFDEPVVLVAGEPLPDSSALVVILRDENGATLPWYRWLQEDRLRVYRSIGSPALRPGTEYALIIGGATDAAGNRAESLIVRFTTVPRPGQGVVRSWPADGDTVRAEEVNERGITVVSSEPFGSIDLRSADGQTMDWSFDGATPTDSLWLTLDPDARLLVPGQGYQVLLWDRVTVDTGDDPVHVILFRTAAAPQDSVPPDTAAAVAVDAEPGDIVPGRQDTVGSGATFSLDFDPAPGDQGSWRLLTTPGSVIDVQLIARGLPEIAGWEAWLEVPAGLRFVPGSFRAGSFLPGLVVRSEEQDGGIVVGGHLSQTGVRRAGGGDLGTLSLRLAVDAPDSAALVLSRFTSLGVAGEAIEWLPHAQGRVALRPPADATEVWLEVDLRPGDAGDRIEGLSPYEAVGIRVRVSHDEPARAWGGCSSSTPEGRPSSGSNLATSSPPACRSSPHTRAACPSRWRLSASTWQT